MRPGDPRDAAELRARLARALDGTATAGEILLPVPGENALGPADEVLLPEAADRSVTSVPVAIRTSGSTSGTSALVGLSASALRASAEATHAALGGPGQWISALPHTHVAGLQVLVRSVLAGIDPVVVDTSAGFRSEALTAALARARDDLPVYLPLVPTMLHRALEDPAATAALSRVDRVLLGGARAPRSLLERAAAAGVDVVRTYGATETAGGCVYDGLPLPGVEIGLDEDGRIRLAGPTLATGYLDDPRRTAREFTWIGDRRWWLTSDHGSLDQEGRLIVRGRLDDVLITGGVNVDAGAVEDVLSAVAGVHEVTVIGVPDPEWGQIVVVAATGTPPPLRVLRERVRQRLGAAAAPRALVHLEPMPRLSSGKTDRSGVAQHVQRALGASPPATDEGAAVRILGLERHRP